MSSVVMSAGTSLFIVLNSYLEEFDTAHLKKSYWWGTNKERWSKEVDMISLWYNEPTNGISIGPYVVF